MGASQGTEAKAQDSRGSLSEGDYRQVQILASSAHFNIQDVRVLHAKFKKLAMESPDPNQITRAQWRQCAKDAGIQGAEIYLDQLWLHFDENRSNTIGFREFVLGLSAMCRGSARQKLELSFEVYDTENNGRISLKEMTDLLVQMDSHAFEYLASTKGKQCDSKELKKRKRVIAKYVESVFEQHDVTRNGYLSMSEYTQAVLMHPALLAYRADSNVLSEIKVNLTPNLQTGNSGSQAPADWEQKEIALIALVNDMKSVISTQARQINELEWEKREGSQNVQLQEQLRRLKAAPIQGGRQGYIAYGVKKGYIMYDEDTRTIVAL